MLLLSSFSASAAQPAEMSVRVPSAASIAEMVPKTGTLGERELALLAIARRPELEALRGAVAVASAQHLAAGDLENPELRFSYAYDNDDRIGEPYTERETVLTDSTESYRSTSSTTGAGESVTDRESGRERTSRFREIERRVTPGATKDIVEERVYETSRSRSSGTRARAESDAKGSASRVDGRRESESRRLVSSTRREIHHPDASGRDNAWGVLMRFRLPHPWERKARIQHAAAEVSLAEAEYLAAEDQVVRTVRGAFHELAILEKKIAAQRQRKAAFESFRDWLEGQKTPKLGLELASSRAKVYETLADIRESEAGIAAMRDELAAYCGLEEAARIDTTMKTRRVSDPAGLDVGYLAGIAMLYRGDVLGTQARLEVARAQLAEARAASVPFATFVDLGYTQMNSLRRTGQNDEWFARIGVSIPLWDWTGINKRRRVPEAATQSLELRMAMQRSLIATEVAQAVKRLAAAESQLRRQDQDLAALRADRKKSMDDAKAASADMGDLIKARKIEHDFHDLELEMEESRCEALSAYHEALMALEKALGVRLERALGPATGR